MSKIALWQPKKDDIEKSNLFKFIQYVNTEYNKDFIEYNDLYNWSVNDIDNFWEACLKYSGIKLSKP